MPSVLKQLKPQHASDDLDHGFDFAGFGAGDNVSTFVVTVPAGVTQSTAATKSGQIVTVWIKGSAALHRIIVDAVSIAGRKATIEADILVSDPA